MRHRTWRKRLSLSFDALFRSGSYKGGKLPNRSATVYGRLIELDVEIALNLHDEFKASQAVDVHGGYWLPQQPAVAEIGYDFGVLQAGCFPEDLQAALFESFIHEGAPKY